MGMVEATISGSAFPNLLGGGTALLSPFQRSPSPSHGSLPPLLGPREASFDQGGHTPLDPPTSFLRNDAALRRNLTESGGEDVLSTPSERRGGLGLNRGHPFSGYRANVRSSAAAEKGGEGMALRI